MTKKNIKYFTQKLGFGTFLQNLYYIELYVNLTVEAWILNAAVKSTKCALMSLALYFLL